MRLARTQIWVAVNVGPQFDKVGRNNEKFLGLIQDTATVQVILNSDKFLWGLQILLKV